MSNKKTVLIAGATSTLGKAFISLYESEYDIIILHRTDLYVKLPEADVLVNCIGDVNLIGLMDTSSEAFDNMIEANLKIPFMLAKNFIAAGGKHIINIGSTRSISPAPDKAIYSATKVALRFLTQSISLETDTKATLICPGNFAEEGTVEATANAINFAILNPEIKEMIINGMI